MFHNVTELAVLRWLCSIEFAGALFFFCAWSASAQLRKEYLKELWFVRAALANEVIENMQFRAQLGLSINKPKKEKDNVSTFKPTP